MISLSRLAICVFLVASIAVAQPKPTVKPDLLEAARAFVRQKDLKSAASTLGAFLRERGEGSIGDARITEGKALLLTTANSLAKDLEAKQPVQAAKALINAAAVPAMEEHKEALHTSAKAILKKAFDASQQKKDAATSIAISDLYTASFPSDLPLADTAALVQLRIKYIAQIKKSARPETLLREARLLKKQGATEDDLKAADLNESQLVLRLAQKTYDRGWYREAIALLREELAAQRPVTPEVKRQLVQLLERSTQGHIAACAQLGNGKMLQDALELYAAPENTAGEPGKVAKYKTQLAKMQTTPMQLKFAMPYLRGETSWMDDGGGYTCDTDIKIGQEGARSENPESGNVTVQPGFVLQGGKIRCVRGKLTFAGTAEKPILLRNVNIECDYVGTIAATFTIFHNCTFRKSGGTYWLGGWSSKWTLDDCLFISSRFRSLIQTDYGIKLRRCTFVDCFLPDRNVSDDAYKDAATRYRHNWNQITEATFYNCQMRPTLVWSTQGSVFYDCEIREGSVFVSSKEMQVPMAVPVDDSRFVEALNDQTRLGGPGTVAYDVTLIDKQQPRPSPLWKLASERPGAPEDTSDTDDAPKGKAE